MGDEIQPKTIVRATTHTTDTRPDIPTTELESFARPEEKRPTIVRYPRDTTRDPQLAWKGKDEQDADDLNVPAVPIYVGDRFAHDSAPDYETRIAQERAAKDTSFRTSPHSVLIDRSPTWCYEEHAQVG